MLKELHWCRMRMNSLGNNLHKRSGADQNLSNAILPQNSQTSLGETKATSSGKYRK